MEVDAGEIPATKAGFPGDLAASGGAVGDEVGDGEVAGDDGEDLVQVGGWVARLETGTGRCFGTRCSRRRSSAARIRDALHGRGMG